MAEEEVFFPTEEIERTERSLAQILKSQYTSTNWDDIFGATEIREHEVTVLSTVFMNRIIEQIISTSEEVLVEGLTEEEHVKIIERLALKNMMLKDPNAMVFAMYDSWTYAFGLLRKSLMRQSRKEGVQIASAGISRAYGGEEIGFGQKLLSKFGLGKYKVMYSEKGEK